MPNEVSAEIQELESLRKQIRVWRTSLTAAFGIVTVISLVVMWSAISGLATNGEQQTKFITAASNKLQTDILPNVEQIGVSAFHQIDFQSEFKKLNDRAPELANASALELQTLAKNLPEKGGKVLSSEFDSVLSSRKDKLKQEFPEATDEQVTALLTNLTAETHAQVSDIADSLFNPHIETLNNVMVDLSKIEASEAPNIKGEVPTWQMAFLLADIARADMTALDAKAATPAPAKKK
ncbi:MAG TPA: hypothetical protein VGK19_03830 [Capsulimonadaceae bacterium]|jgi:hypothetical protein